ncbi:MAG: transglycosylase domain-containing protein, partial [Euzebyales bacterium]|nr:transglycosylase domain-containing protein [Euzebyales bacterium]
AEQLAAAPDRALPPLAERSVVRAADGTVLATLHGEIDRRLVELAEIPAHTRAAVIAAEDRDFFTHDGFDAQGMARAAWANLRAGTIVQGGSTLTQQLAKQNHAGPARTFERKAREIVYAMALEQLFTKEQLLERYLNEVYFGSGAYGVATAAEEFFGVDVADLTVGESALLAGLVRSPNALDPRANPADALRVRDQVLSAMVSDGAVDARTREAARAAPLAVAPPVAPEVVDPFVVEALKREVLADPAFGATREDRVRALFAGGLEITLTVDPALQEAARQAVASHAEGTEATRAAVVATDPRTGAVRALYSGGDFGDSQFDLATQGRRQPGSAFKPFVAAAALEAGWTGEELLTGAASATFPDPSGSTWTVTNFAGASYEDMDLGDALAASVNTAFGQLVTEVGVEAVTDVLGRVGIDVDAALGPPRRRGPAIALGGIDQGVSPLEMASAYGTFANGGRHVSPTLIERAVSTDGEVVRALDPQPRQALDPAVNARMVEVLSDVVAEGTGAAARLPGQRPIGKTGTSQASADAWFVGATDELSAAVWMGDPTRRSPLPGVTGGETAAPVWQAFMTAALAEQP